MKLNSLIWLLGMTLTLTATACSDDKVDYKPVDTSINEVRGIWIPAPGHTKALTTYDNIKETVNYLSGARMNTIFVCVLSGPQTPWPSQVLFENGDYGDISETVMPGFSTYTGGTGDPMRDLIDAAHDKDIKVIFWFEYGFQISHGVPNSANHPIYRKNPDWAGLQSNGTTISNYNNSDYYFNSYDPRVQKFVLDLVDESLTKYPEVDGIQGDDRMPAAPRNSGYDDVTKAMYLTEKGSNPPSNYNDTEWVEWRLDKLNKFAKELHTLVKKHGSDKLVCFSPNPYPWCMQNLMQDWPQWLRDDVVDLLSVQCYRYNYSGYAATVDQAMEYVKENTNKNVLNPGIILKGGENMSASVLKQQMNHNRKIGTNGEAFFWLEGLELPGIYNTVNHFYKLDLYSDL